MNEGEPTPQVPAEKPRASSSWDALKKRVAAGLMAGSVLLGSGMPAAEAAVGSPQPAAAAEQAKGYRDRIQESTHLYEASFESSKESLVRMVKLSEEITHSPEFKSLNYLDRAELKHREGYAKQQIIRVWFDSHQKTLSAKDAEGLAGSYDEVHALLREAIQTELDHGSLTQDRQRSLNALISTGQLMAEQGIQLEVERPDLSDIAKRLKATSDDYVAEAMSIDAKPRYVGGGLFVFAPDQKLGITRGVVDLAKFTGDLAPDTEQEKGATLIGGVHYSVSKEVAPWANSVATGATRASPEGRAFLDQLVELKVLRRQGNQFSAIDVESITLTPPTEMVFTHEAAHKVEHEHSGYLEGARQMYKKLTPADRELFNAFMDKANPDSTEEQRMSEFFAYEHQSGRDWHDHARKVLGR